MNDLSKVVAVRLPPNVAAALEQAARAELSNKSTIARRILAEHLGQIPPARAQVGQIGGKAQS